MNSMVRSARLCILEVSSSYSVVEGTSVTGKLSYAELWSRHLSYPPHQLLGGGCGAIGLREHELLKGAAEQLFPGHRLRLRLHVRHLLDGTLGSHRLSRRT